MASEATTQPLARSRYSIGLVPALGALLVALAICMAFCAAINVTVELIAYRRLRGAPRLAPLITAIGASFILQNVGLAWKGPIPISPPDLLPKGKIFDIGGGAPTPDPPIVLLVSGPALLLLIL